MAVCNFLLKLKAIKATYLKRTLTRPEMNQRPSFFIYRNRNKQLVKNIMNNLDWQENNNDSDLSCQDKYSLEQLKAMSLVAKMKEAADRAGAGFVGGFVTPTGQRFMMSNVDETDVQFQAIHRELQQMQDLKKDTEIKPQDLFDRLGSIKIESTEEGIRFKIEPEAE
jgi:hypothetical protein